MNTKETAAVIAAVFAFGILVGIFIAIAVTSSNVSVHAQMLREHDQKHQQELALRAYAEALRLEPPLSPAALTNTLSAPVAQTNR